MKCCISKDILVLLEVGADVLTNVSYVFNFDTLLNEFKFCRELVCESGYTPVGNACVTECYRLAKMSWRSNLDIF